MNKPAAPSPLEDVRRDIDRIDDEIAALIEARFAAVERVRLAKVASPARAPFRPFREAAVIGRMVKNRGPHVPGGLMVRLWRAIMTAAIARQQAVSVHVPSALLADAACRDLIRDYFGPLAIAAAGDVRAALARQAAVVSDLAVVATVSDWTGALAPGQFVTAALPMTVQGAPQLLIIGHDGTHEEGPGLSLVVSPADLGAARWQVSAHGVTVAAFADGAVPEGRAVGRIPLPLDIQE